MTDMAEAYLGRLEPEVSQFEANAALWRLEAAQRAYRLVEDSAVGADFTKPDEEARVALEGIEFDIDRLQAFARTHPGLPYQLTLRLAEVGVDMETARRRLQKALLAAQATA